jgi:hypothetical protein
MKVEPSPALLRRHADATIIPVPVSHDFTQCQRFEKRMSCREHRHD